MSQSQADRARKESPFWGLLADAKEVDVRELDLSVVPTKSVENILREFDASVDGNARRAFLVSVKAFPPSPLGSTSPQEPIRLKAGQITENAEILLVHGEYVLARHLFAYVLKEIPTEVRSLRGLGICMLKLGDLLSARKCFRALMDHRPGPDCYFWIAQCYLSEGNDSLALHYLRKVDPVSALSPDNQFLLHKEAGNCLARMDRPIEAESEYRKGLAINPSSSALFVNLGTLQLQAKDSVQAKQQFEQALKIQPDNQKALCGLGMALLSEGDTDGAEANFEAALDKDSQSAVAIHHIVVIAHQKDKFDMAKLRLRAFLEKSPHSADIRYSLAAILFREKDWQGSESELVKNLSQFPSHRKTKELLEEIRAHKHRFQ